MRVRVLGGLTVDGAAERELGSRKARTLLKVLVLARGSAVPVDRLADVLWPDQQPARPADQVAVLVSRLRGVVGADRLVRGDGGYSGRVDWLDVDELAARVGEAADALVANRVGAARAAAQSALALDRGLVLPEEDGEWVEVDRAACAAMIGTARRIAAEAAARAGDHLGAIGAAEVALAHDPYDEAALRILMRAHVAAGRPASALSAYVRVRARLIDDLGVSPAAKTEALHEAIVLDDVPAAPEPANPAPLPGREAALAALAAALDRAATTTEPVAVTVLGQAGIGKTALLDHWCRATQRHATVLVGRCDALGRDLPLQPIADAIAAHLATLDDETRRAALGPDVGVLGTLLGVHSGLATMVADPDLGRVRLFTALLGLVTRLADGAVAVLVVDDVHLADESTLAWLRLAVRRPGRLLVVTAGRPGGDVAIAGAAPIVLGPLDVEAVAAFVGRDRAAELHARSGGHPLLLAALAASDEESQPGSVHDAVERRLESLGGAADTVRPAAVLGTDVDLDLLAQVLHVDTGGLLTDLEAAVAGGVLIERGAGFAFRHELEREALETSAGAARRALVHRDAARVLAARAAPDPLVVAVHARLGGEAGLAAEWLTRAADVAMARYDTDDAERHLDAALSLADAGVTRAARARLLMATGRLEEAAADAAHAVAAVGDAAALEVSGWVAYYRRRYYEALVFAEAALERAGDGALRVSCLALTGRVRHASGAVAEAVTDLETAVAEKARPEVRALAGVWLAHARLHQGRPEEAIPLVDRALVDPDRIAHPFAPLHAWFARAMALGQLGRADEALRACDELDAEIARRGEAATRMAAPAANVRAWLLRWTGRPAEADELNRGAIATSNPRGVRAEAYYAGLLDLADGRLLAGDDGGAADLLDPLIPIEHWHGTMAWHHRQRWHLLRARLALRDGDRDRAEELSAAVVADAAARGTRRYELLARGVNVLAGGDHTGVDAVVGGLRTCAALDGVAIIEALEARPR